MKCFKGINLFSLVGIQPLSLKFVDIITKGQITFGISSFYFSPIKCKYYSRIQLKTDARCDIYNTIAQVYLHKIRIGPVDKMFWRSQ